MRPVILGGLITLALALPLPLRAEPAAQAVQDVIDAQIAAFLQDDMARAFTYASPGLRRHFGTPERFGAMVRQGYPMVWRPGAVRYLDLGDPPGGATGRQRQIVEITDRAGQTFRLEYSMQQTPEGWRIDGVRFLPMPMPVG